MIRDQGNTPAFLKVGACSRYTLAAYRGAHLTCASVALISKRLPNPTWSSWNWVCKKGKDEVLKNSYEWGQQKPLFDFMRRGLPLCLQCLFPALCWHGHSLVLNTTLCRTTTSSEEVCQHLGVHAVPPKTMQESSLMGIYEKNLTCLTSCQHFYLGLVLVSYLFSETNTKKRRCWGDDLHRADFHLQLRDQFRNKLLMFANDEPRCIGAFLNWVLPPSR